MLTPELLGRVRVEVSGRLSRRGHRRPAGDRRRPGDDLGPAGLQVAEGVAALGHHGASLGQAAQAVHPLGPADGDVAAERAEEEAGQTGERRRAADRHGCRSAL